MNDNDVSYYYKEALATDSFTVHNNFLNMLLQDDSALGMERHYCYFKDSENAYLKRILGKGFLKRGREGMLFLEEKLKTETDALAKSNVIHLIGLSYNKEYLPYILPYLDDADKEIRYKAIIACGWLGDAEAIKILKEHYATEKDTLLRGFIVSAMRQIFFGHKETKQQIVCKNARRNRQRIACHYDSCSSGPYKDEIWFERRIELWYYFGQCYTSCK